MRKLRKFGYRTPPRSDTVEPLALSGGQRGLTGQSASPPTVGPLVDLMRWRWQAKHELKSGELTLDEALRVLILQTELTTVVVGLAALAPEHEMEHREAAEFARRVCAPLRPRTTLAMLDAADHRVLNARWRSLLPTPAQ